MDVEARDACIVVRSVGERTTAACREILAAQFPPAGTVVVQESPFSVAVRRTFEAGLDLGSEWTVAVDADVLLRPGAVTSLIELARSAPPEVFEVQVELLDKGFAVSRTCGFKAFRTRLLGQALDFVDDGAGLPRPETHVAHRMRDLGRPFVKHPVTLGLHDFEQDYRDLFRKGALHARKHENRMSYARRMWDRLGREDPDYRALSIGAEHGVAVPTRIVADARAVPSEVDELLAAEGLEPKPDLFGDGVSASDVEQTLWSFREPLEVRLHRWSSGRWNRWFGRLPEPIRPLRALVSGASPRRRRRGVPGRGGTGE